MFSLLSVNVVYIALSAAKLVFSGLTIDNIVTLASAVHSHLARIRRQNRQRPQPCTHRRDIISAQLAKSGEIVETLGSTQVMQEKFPVAGL